MTGDVMIYSLANIENYLSGIYSYAKGFVIFYVCLAILSIIVKLLSGKDCF